MGNRAKHRSSCRRAEATGVCFSHFPFPRANARPHTVATPEIADSDTVATPQESRTHARCLARSPAGRALASMPCSIALATATRWDHGEAHAGPGGARGRPVRLAALRNDRADLRSGCARWCGARCDPAVLARRRATARSALAATAALVAADRRAPAAAVDTYCSGGAAGSRVAPAHEPATRCSEPGQQADPSFRRDRAVHRSVIRCRRIVRHSLSPSVA